MRSPDEVLALYTERLRFYTPVHAAMRAISDIYEGTATINLPDMDRDESPSVPNLLAQGVDQMAGRVASVTPQVSFASDNPGQRTADRRAATARRTVQGWWQVDRLRLKNKQRARHILAYAWGPTTLRFDHKLHRPTWEVRSPLETYPNPETINGTFLPNDVIFAYRRSIGWLCTNGYMGQVMALLGPNGIRDAKRDADLLMLEYVDPDGRMLILTGQTGSYTHDLPWSTRPASSTGAVLCEYGETRGVMTASVPTRIALNRPSGQFDGMVGMYYAQAKLMALEVIAVEKGIFPDTYLVGRQNETPRFLDGPHDGRSGAINVVTGGDVREVQTAPGYMTNQTIDRIERGQRLTAGIPQEFGGESTSNIRTGRRGDSVLSAVIDFPVGDIQDIFSYALMDEDKAAIALAKEFDGSAPPGPSGWGRGRRPARSPTWPTRCSSPTSTPSPTRSRGRTRTRSWWGWASGSAWARCPRSPPPTWTRSWSPPNWSTTGSSRRGWRPRSCPASSRRRPPGNCRRWCWPR